MKTVFLLSLPRSGSTLLQRLLTYHPQIDSQPEPWLLMPFFLAIKGDLSASLVNHKSTSLAINELLKNNNICKREYVEWAYESICTFYNKISTANIFLDKTPRYSFFADLLVESLNGKTEFIVLWRDPLDTISSLITTWSKNPDGDWNLKLFENDFKVALPKLCGLLEKGYANCMFINYEDLVHDETREKIILKILSNVGVDSDVKCVLSKNILFENASLGDPTGVKKYDSVSKQSVGKWERLLINPYRCYRVKRLIKEVGRENIELMGYDMDYILSRIVVNSYNPKMIILDILRDCYWSMKGCIRNKAIINELPS